jgi:hypothetical protein
MRGSAAGVPRRGTAGQGVPLNVYSQIRRGGAPYGTAVFIVTTLLISKIPAIIPGKFDFIGVSNLSTSRNHFAFQMSNNFFSGIVGKIGNTALREIHRRWSGLIYCYTARPFSLRDRKNTKECDTIPVQGLNPLPFIGVYWLPSPDHQTLYP